MPDPGPDHLLDHDPHLLVHVEEVPLGPVADRIGAEDRCVHLGHGVQQGSQPDVARSPVREEEALVLPRKRGTRAVLQQAGAPHDERHVTEVIQRDGKAAHQFGRERRGFEDLYHVGILLPHLLQFHVLPVVDILQPVVTDEGDDPIRSHVPRPRHPDPAKRFVPLLLLLDDLLGQEDPGALAAQLPVAVGRVNEVGGQVVEVLQTGALLRRVYVVDLVREESAHQRGAQDPQQRRGELPLSHLESLEATQGIDDVAERGFLPLERIDEEAELVAVDPAVHAGEDLLFAAVLGRYAEHLVRGDRLFLERPAGRGLVLVDRLGALVGGPSQSGRLREPRHPLPLQVVQHPPTDPLQELRVRPVQEFDDDLPLAAVLQLGALEGRIPALPRARKLLVRELEADLLGNGANQLPLLLEERSLFGGRALPRIDHLERSALLLLHAHRLLQPPRTRDVARRLRGESLQLEARLAYLRVLQARWHDLQDPGKPRGPWHVSHAQDLPDLVQAAELLRPLLKVPQDVVHLVLVVRHFRITPRPVRPSTSTSSGSGRRTCLTYAVSITASCRASHSQSIPPSAAPCLTVK